MTKIEQKFRELHQLASWEGNTALMWELEATGFRVLGINLDAERRARLAASDNPVVAAAFAPPKNT